LADMLMKVMETREDSKWVRADDEIAKCTVREQTITEVSG